MKRAVDILRQLRTEIPYVPSNDYNRGYHEALNELEERILDAMWEVGDDDTETVTGDRKSGLTYE